MNALATTLCAILTALFPSARPNRVRAPSPLLFWTHFAQAIDEFNHLLAIWRATAQVAPPPKSRHRLRKSPNRPPTRRSPSSPEVQPRYPTRSRRIVSLNAKRTKVFCFFFSKKKRLPPFQTRPNRSD